MATEVMDVTLLYFDGCPNWKDTEEKVRQALEHLALPEGSLTLRRVHTTEEAERLSFHGSPTVLINGIDPFAEPDAPVGLMCRVYRTDGGMAGSPTLQGPVKALTSQM